jgi:hypothetical protein
LLLASVLPTLREVNDLDGLTLVVQGLEGAPDAAGGRVLPMSVADLKASQAYAREVNEKMQRLRDNISVGNASQVDVMTELIAGLAQLSAMVEKLAEHLLGEASDS